MRTIEKLTRQIKKTNSILCVGLDPRINDSQDKGMSKYNLIVEHNERIISATEHQCACYKPNIAFYEQWGTEGWKALEWTMERIPDEIPVILDAKRGDIGATAKAYANAAFGLLKVDAITLAPYMGAESSRPFLEYDDKLCLILSRTSNPQSELLQRKHITGIHNTQELYLEVADQFSKLSENVGFVIGANCYEELEEFRKRYPHTWILAPGIGAQGGKIEPSIYAGLGEDGLGLLPVVARGIAHADNPEHACAHYNEQINTAIQQYNFKRKNKVVTTTTISKLQQNIIEKLFQYECVKIGSFVLKSGITSPFYIDLRRVISFPDLFELVVQAYCNCVKELDYDSIAGIPTAALPFAGAVTQKLDVPMIYPRIPKKPHGTGNLIEGAYEKGDKVLLLDDLITQGKSKKEALDIFREAEVRTKDIVVLICRSYNASSDMEALGVKLHYALHIDDIISHGRMTGLISDEDVERVKKFLELD